MPSARDNDGGKWDPLAAFRADLRSARRRLAALGPSVVATSLGPVQYVDRGAGFPILLVHGIFGGCDAGLRLAEPDLLARHRAISPSRFGYLDTPMPAEPNVQLQADLHAALLDELGVDRAVVYAGSAGGTSALQLAIRHPDRVAGLVLQSTNVPGPHHDKAPVPPVVARRLWGSDLAMWLVRRYLTGWILQLMGVPKGLPLTEADRDRVAVELDGIFPVSERIDGIMFDAFAGNPDINHHYDFGSIVSPTLVVHFRDDGGPPYAGAVDLVGRIPGARLLTGERGGHLGLGEHPDLTDGIEAFLGEVTRA